MTPRNKSVRLVAIVAALSLTLAACASDDDTTASSDTTIDPGTVTTDPVGDTSTTTSTSDTSAPDDATDEDLQELGVQASVISTHVAEADIEELTQGWTVIQDHVDQLTMNGSSIDDSMREIVSADLEAFDTTMLGYESTLSSEFVADWESFHADFQALLNVTG